MFAAWMATVQQQSRLCNPLETLSWSSHKSYLRDLEAAGIPTVPTVWLRPGEEGRISEAAAQFGRTPARF